VPCTYGRAVRGGEWGKYRLPSQPRAGCRRNRAARPWITVVTMFTCWRSDPMTEYRQGSSITNGEILSLNSDIKLLNKLKRVAIYVLSDYWVHMWQLSEVLQPGGCRFGWNKWSGTVPNGFEEFRTWIKWTLKCLEIKSASTEYNTHL